MPVTSLTRNIDGLQITVAQLGGWDALRVMRKLAEAIGPSLAETMRHLPQQSGTKLFDLDVADIVKGIAPALDRFFDKMSEDQLIELTKTLLKGALVVQGGKAAPLLVVFDSVFMGKPQAIVSTILFALSVNYDDFWQGLAALGVRAQAGQNSAASPKTSAETGLAGASS